MDKTSRPQRTDGEITYNRILEAAGELIAKSGFAETTSKAIAQHAGIDLASVNYHFGSRGGLYEAVLIEAHQHVTTIETLQGIAANHSPAADKLKKIIEVLVDGSTAHKSWYTKVLIREVLSPSSYLKILQKKEVLPKLQIILSILSEITLIPANDSRLYLCLINIVAPCVPLARIRKERSYHR
jgi:AcrR family transcriptional regulator